MLKYIDVFIGVALIMLGVSLVITIATQIISFVFNLRGRQLRQGLAELLATLLPQDLKLPQAKQVANALLHNTLIADGLGRTRLAPAVSRADLVNLLRTQTLIEGDVITNAIASKLRAVAGHVDQWFDATMSRVANRFTMQVRWVTIAAGSIMAVALQLDAFGLVQRLYADADLRASLVGATSTMLGNAEEVLSPPTLYRDAAATLAKESGGGLPAPTGSFASRDEAELWIRSQVADPAQSATLIARYETLLRQAVQAKVPRLLDKAVAIKLDMERSSGFHLIPDPYRPFDFPNIWVFLGVLTSAGLLSLGAPFWFNMLKTASNLRPAIAAYAENRKEPETSPATNPLAPAPGQGAGQPIPAPAGGKPALGG